MENEVLKEAINNGINGDAISSTIDDIVNKAEMNNSNPKQMKLTIETIIHMKKNINSIPDKKYASNLVSQNSGKIKAAINDGISPNEIAATLMEGVEKANTRRTKSRLKL